MQNICLKKEWCESLVSLSQEFKGEGIWGVDDIDVKTPSTLPPYSSSRPSTELLSVLRILIVTIGAPTGRSGLVGEVEVGFGKDGGLGGLSCTP